MSCFDELRELEDQGIDLVEVLGQDRHLASPDELQELIGRLGRCGENLHSELLYVLTHRRFPADDAKALWRAIMKHKKRMSSSLGRAVTFRVAALDYMTTNVSSFQGVRLIARPEFELVQSYVNVDEVTGVFNRRYFHEALKREFHRARRYESPLSLLIVDVDDFKRVNDVHGHIEGDVVLRKVGGLLKDNTRQADSVCRYGGDEFAIVLPQTSQDDAKTLAERVCKAMARVAVNGQDPEESPSGALWSVALTEIVGAGSQGGEESASTNGGGHVTASIGGATYPRHCEELEELIALADQMCLEAKRTGKDRVCISEDSGDWLPKAAESSD